MGLFTRAADHRLDALLEKAGANIQRSAQLLRELLAELPERSGLAEEIKTIEQEGDRVTHEIILSLGSGPRRLRPLLDTAGAYALAGALDDVVDHTEQTAALLGLYGIEAPMEQAVAMADVLVAAGEQIAGALAMLQEKVDLAPRLVEIHRLENEGDRLLRDGLRSLFAGGVDPMVVIRWKDVFESLEAAIDACETVAHSIERIALRRARR
jgi:uncharacterized protein